MNGDTPSPSDENQPAGAQDEGEDGGQSEKFWTRLGFESWRAYMDYLEEQQSRSTIFRRRSVDLPPTGAQVPPGATPPSPTPQTPKEVHQLGLKLAIEDYDDLAEAADAYGVAPTTLARMLVRRGVRAMLRAERGEASGE